KTKQISTDQWTYGEGDKNGFDTCFDQLERMDIDCLYFIGVSGKRRKGSHVDLDHLTRVCHDHEIHLLRLIKALGKKISKNTFMDCYILTCDNHGVTGTATQPYGGGVTGLAYAIAQGDHRFLVRNIDLSSLDFQNEKIKHGLSQMILDEGHSDRGEVIKFQSGKRYRQTFFKLDWGEFKNSSAIKKGGVYVILGGSGSVGRVITRFLISDFKAQVIWVGRKPDDSPVVKERIASYKRYGNPPFYMEADATDLDSIKGAVNKIRSRFGRINGAIFSGIVFDFENSVAGTTEEDFLNILDVKTIGSINFYRAFIEEALDFMCYYSSGQAFSFSGAATLSAYACGITFSDTFIRSLQENAPFPVGTINWGFWKSSLEETPLDHAIESLEDKKGFDCFDRFIQGLTMSFPGGKFNQVLCMNASKPVARMMNVDKNAIVSIYGQRPAVPAALQNETIDYQDKIQKLIQADDKHQDLWLAGRLLAKLQEMGILVHGTGFEEIAAVKMKAAVIDAYDRWWDESLHMLEQNGFVQQEKGRVRVNPATRQEQSKGLPQSFEEKRKSLEDGPGVKPEMILADDCLKHLPEILQGRVQATDILFSESSMEKVEAVYKNNPVPDFFNEVVADAVNGYLARLFAADPDAEIRIIEIGAGTGGTSSVVLPRLLKFKFNIREYCYTDISQAFLIHAKENYGQDYPFLTCQLWDMEKPAGSQGIDAGGYDLVIAANVLHATKNIRQTLNHAKFALKTNGMIILNEISKKTLVSHLTFGLLKGWWLHEDNDIRIPGSPGIYPETWDVIMAQEGFEDIIFPGKKAHGLGQQIITAQSNGLVFQAVTKDQGPGSQEKEFTETPVAGSCENNTASMAQKGSKDIKDWVVSQILKALSQVLKVSVTRIDRDIPFMDYGIDSILGVGFVKKINKAMGISMNTAVLFDYTSVDRLAGHVMEAHGKKIRYKADDQIEPRGFDNYVKEQPDTSNIKVAVSPCAKKIKTCEPFRVKERDRDSRLKAGQSQIAVIGISGQFPKACNVHELWQNLINGRDGVDELPGHYLDQENFFHNKKQSGKTYCKWGGILQDRDCFDPLFFKISPLEAESMNPHQRLVMQESWKALEDAGYNPRTLEETRTGLFIGAEPSGFSHDSFTGASDAIIASRLSYHLNLKGPAMVINTGCSSSGVAIHQACESLRSQESVMALAGGVFAVMDQDGLVNLSDIEMLSPTGRCRTFDAAGDGAVMSEGVGMVLLKPLSNAIEDNDSIYGIIHGSGLNQDGASNGITAPNGVSQESLIIDVYNRFNIDPSSISYVEAHGTGTKLGDTVEANALVRAFKTFTSKKHFCRVGSAKAHLGHTSAAAGVIGLIKILLSIKHRLIPGLLHFNKLNPLIEFSGSAFHVNKKNTDWEAENDCPRLAAMNSFGHSGTNVHLVVGEYIPSQKLRQNLTLSNDKDPILIPLSARDKDRLKSVAENLLIHLGNGKQNIQEIAYTLQTGREAMDERLIFLVRNMAELIQKLQACVMGENKISHCWKGDTSGSTASLLASDEEGREMVRQWIFKGKFEKVAQVWSQGVAVAWNEFYGAQRPQRISLPAYPFAKDRYWPETLKSGTTAQNIGVPFLHPMLHQNTSDLYHQSFSSFFNGKEFFLKNHLIQGKKILPAVASLEMAYAAVFLSTGYSKVAKDGNSKTIKIENVVWVQPLEVFDHGKQVHLSISPAKDSQIRFEIHTVSDNQTGSIVHTQGNAAIEERKEIPLLDLADLEAKINQKHINPGQCYDIFKAAGITHGPEFQCLKEINTGNGQVLAKIALPSLTDNGYGLYTLHPGMMDSALQAAIAMTLDDWDDSKVLTPSLPFAMDELEIYKECQETMWVWIRSSKAPKSDANIVKLDVDLCDKKGEVCIRIKGFLSRTKKSQTQGFEKNSTLICHPVWKELPIIEAKETSGFRQHLVFLCGLEQFSPGKIKDALKDVSCIRLKALGENIAKKFEEYSIQVFEKIKDIFPKKHKGAKTLIQILIPSSGEENLLCGLSAMLKTMHLENPECMGQIIEIEKEETHAGLLKKLVENRNAYDHAHIRYSAGKRMIVLWEEMTNKPEPSRVPFKDKGVYLITGGAGGLGMALARAILENTRDVKLILAGRSVLTDEKIAAIKALAPSGSVVEYSRADISREKEVRELVKGIREEFGSLNGIFHGAGVIADNFIIKKHAGEFESVLAPKVRGTVFLDQATCDMDLDFFVMFSSGAGVFGNVGQADYACANAFMDAYAEFRSTLVRSKNRRGTSLSINWPLLKEGGMPMDETTKEILLQRTGMVPMESTDALETLIKGICAQEPRIMVMSGDLPRLKAAFVTGQPNIVTSMDADDQILKTKVPPATATGSDKKDVKEKALQYFIQVLASTLKMSAHQISPEDSFDKFGIDSIVVMKLTDHLEKTFSSLSKTLFFEYRNINEITQYFLEFHKERLLPLLGLDENRDAPELLEPLGESEEMEKGPGMQESDLRLPLGSWQNVQVSHESSSSTALDIAIIGISGRYPQAYDLTAFWQNLSQGKDCITKIPKERWIWQDYYTEDNTGLTGHTSKWGGFIKDADKFDPLFFNISPREAELMDPQERLFLEHVWTAMEDAGYCREDLRKKAAINDSTLSAPVGVYAGVMYGEYQLFGAQESLLGNPVAVGGSYASIANRVSYIFDFSGPSMTVDSMCSSSLTTLHLACQDLRQGNIDLGVAGGVNLSIHPNKYLMLSTGQFISTSGHCQSFGKGGDGYIPGEGVGVAILKRLSEAKRDGDHIYGVIKGSAINHGGRTNGYSVPNPHAQSRVIEMALKEAGIHPNTISYIEAHGTGTKLGDPIEIAGLTRAFEKFTKQRQYCYIGSAKSNLGHCESAAGIAGITKVLLQMKHGRIVPSLHAGEPNPNINFEATPFMVNQALRKWHPLKIDGRIHARRAGISSFGAGGANAHIIIEEYRPPGILNKDGSQQIKAQKIKPPLALIILSAKNRERLEAYAQNLLAFIRSDTQAFLMNKDANNHISLKLEDIAYTLQTGREAMAERLGFAAASLEEVQEKLKGFLSRDGKKPEYFLGRADTGKQNLKRLSHDEDMAKTVDAWLDKGKITKLLDLWVQGFEFDWNRLYRNTNLQENNRPSRISLPTYPFARERYWISQITPGYSNTGKAIFHPFVHENTSGLSGLRFSSQFSGQEFFLKDHKVHGQKILPAVAYLEMAVASMGYAVEGPETGMNRIKRMPMPVRLEHVVWVRPLGVDQQPETVHISLIPQGGGPVKYEIYTDHGNTDESKVFHSQGVIVANSTARESVLDLAVLQDEICREQLSAGQCYSAFEAMGIAYGMSHQGIDSLWIGQDQVLANLKIPDVVAGTLDQYILHPSLMDSALQASIGLTIGGTVLGAKDRTAQDNLFQPVSNPSLPFEMETIEIFSPCTSSMWAHIRYSGSGKKNQDGKTQKLDMDLCDDHGLVCVAIKGFSSRPLAKNYQEKQSSQRISQEETLTENGSMETSRLTGLNMLSPVWNPVPEKDMSAPLSLETENIVIIGGTHEQEKAVAGVCPKAKHISEFSGESVEEMAKDLTALDPLEHVVFIVPQHLLKSMWDSTIVQGQKKGVVHLFKVIKAFLVAGYGVSELTWTIITAKVLETREKDGGNPTHAGIFGLADTMAAEYPHWKIRAADMASLDQWSLESLFSIPTPQKGAWVQRKRKWFRQVLVPHRPYSANPVGRAAKQPFLASKDGKSGYRSNGVYVVIGGAGGIGEAWTRYMMEKYQAQVIWIGRRKKDTSISQKIIALEHLGKVPDYIRADAADESSLEKAYGIIKKKYGQIHGVIHSAIVLADKSLANMDTDQFCAGLSAKVDVSVCMARVFKKEPLDFVLFFSSMVSFGNAPGQSNYAAGCTFKDAYAKGLAKAWHCPVKVMNWGYWGSTGIVSDATYRDRMAKIGLESIEPEEGMAALETLVQSPVDQMALIKTNRPLVLDRVDMSQKMEIFPFTIPSVIQDLSNHLPDHAAKVEKTIADYLSDYMDDNTAMESMIHALLKASLVSLGLLNEKNDVAVNIRQDLNLPSLYKRWLKKTPRVLELETNPLYDQNIDPITDSASNLTLDLDTLWRKWEKQAVAWKKTPGFKAQVVLAEACLRALPGILTGKKRVADILFPNGSMELVEGIYKGNRPADLLNDIMGDMVVACLKERRNQNPEAKIRIFEIGAGTGGTTAPLLERLSRFKEHIQEYCYTDVSKAFLMHARDQYTPDHSYLVTKNFDVTKSLASQNIRHGRYDLVIAANVLHATKNIRGTLRNAKALLRSNGLILINELCRSSLFAHVTFGLLEGWWAYEDTDLRIPGCPGLSPKTWDRVLTQEGFGPIHFPVPSVQRLGQQIILGQSNGVIRQKASLPGKADYVSPKTHSVLPTQETATKRTGRKHLSRKSAPVSRDILEGRVHTILTECIGKALKMDPGQLAEIPDDQSFAEIGIDSIIAVHLINQINKACGILLQTTILFDYNTVDQLLGYILTAHKSAVTGLMDDGPPQEKIQEAEEPAITLTKDIDPGFPGGDSGQTALYHRALIEGPGQISDLKLTQSIIPVPGDDDVCIAVQAFSLNFADLLCVKGLYPNMPSYPFTPGGEASGIVVGVGKKVDSVKQGDAVVVLAGACHASMVVCHKDRVFQKPLNLSFEEACSLPVVTLTMIDAFHRAQVKKGEKILIQTAAGGTGLIAVQLARHYGAQIYATAGSEHKLSYLREQGVSYLINYLEKDFESELLDLTQRKGVDVVINTLSGDAIQKGLNCLAPKGRYVEIAMAALKSARTIDLSVLSANQTFFSLDIGKLFVEDPEQIKEYCSEMIRLLEQDIIRPTVCKIFALDELKKAYEFMENRNNIGKIVVRVPKASGLEKVPETLLLQELNESRNAGLSQASSRVPSHIHGDLAIIGMSGRFADSDNLEAFWEHLSKGNDLVTRASRWKADIGDAKSSEGKQRFKGSFLNNIDQFDPLFFKISGTEAAFMDPQQRLFLEEAYKALEDAGYAGQRVQGKNCGIYAGCTAGDYTDLFKNPGPPQSFWGNAGSVIPARIAYYLDLKGPAVAVDTACSSSLVAIHLACQGLWSGETKLALAGGVFVQSTPEFYHLAHGAQMLSPSGKCRAFDEKADGFVPGEGVGLVVLKRLPDAVSDGDRIYAVIQGSAMNQDGNTNGITAPSALSQERLERQVYDRFNINPDHIQMMEAHGTGTPLGDPIEYQALCRAFEHYTRRQQYCALGTVKTNIGHLATAAGIAGVIKILLALKHKKIPPSLHFRKANKHIRFEKTPFYVNTQLRDWDVRENAKRRAATSAFGFSGTNVHMVIQEWTGIKPQHSLKPGYLVVLSAQTEAQLRSQVIQHFAYFKKNSETDLGDISHTLLVGRKHLNHRLACVAKSLKELTA
ncbi:MAG: SDR family NAD(P)-dependent oxidoreductase, partial [Desulfobacteraceae bacterium]|nr:SDR family NAD(P)-dependent oxidoreductase [Desulfobacteraceae bacterium]